MTFVADRTPRRTGLWAGVVMLVVVLIAVVVVSLGGGDGGDGKSTTRSPSGGESQQTGGEASAATLTAEEIVPQEFFGISLPASPAGPRNVNGGRASGFDHSPAGAVLAAIHIATRVQNAVGPAVFAPTINEQVVGADKEALLSRTQLAYAESTTTGTGPNGELVEPFEKARREQNGVWAYRMDAYSRSSAFVNLLLRTVPAGGPAYVNLALAVRWVDGDWRLVAPLNGDLAGGMQQVPDVPAGYVVIGKG